MPFSDKAEILTVQPNEIGQYQDIAIPFIKSALEHTDGETSLGHILSDIATQKRQLWLIRDKGDFIGAVVTEISITQSGQKIGDVTLTSGWNYPLWNHFIDVVSMWFKEMGCTAVQVVGRQGWERRLAGKGFAKRYVVLKRGL